MQSTNHMFLDSPFWTSFFNILPRLGAKTVDFGGPWRPAGSKTDAKNRPSGAQWRQKGSKKLSRLNLDVIFQYFTTTWCQNNRFWRPLAPSWLQNWRQKSPKWLDLFRVRFLDFNNPLARNKQDNREQHTQLQRAVSVFAWFSRCARRKAFLFEVSNCGVRTSCT